MQVINTSKHESIMETRYRPNYRQWIFFTCLFVLIAFGLFYVALFVNITNLSGSMIIINPPITLILLGFAVLGVACLASSAPTEFVFTEKEFKMRKIFRKGTGTTVPYSEIESVALDTIAPKVWAFGKRYSRSYVIRVNTKRGKRIVVSVGQGHTLSILAGRIYTLVSGREIKSVGKEILDDFAKRIGREKVCDNMDNEVNADHWVLERMDEQR